MYNQIPSFGNFTTAATRQAVPYVVTTRTEDLINYVNGQPLVEQDSFVSELGSGALLMGSIQAAPHIIHPVSSFKAARYANRLFKPANGLRNISNPTLSGAYSSYYNALKSGTKIAKCNKDIYKAALHNLRVALQQRKQAEIIKYTAELNHIVANGKNPSLFKRFFTYAKSLGKEHAVATEVTKATAQEAGKAATASAQAAAKTTSFWGKTKNVLGSGGFKSMAIIDGAIETITEIIPTFTKLGAEKGVKQIGKSAVNVAASAGGWVAGAKGGGAAGAAIGTAICPGIGTAIGGAIGGIVGGLLGSWGARKLSKVVTGKTELEKAAEQEAKEQAAVVTKSPEDMQALLALAQEKAMAEGGADAEAAMRAIADIQKNMTIKTATPNFGTGTNPQLATPNFGTSTNPQLASLPNFNNQNLLAGLNEPLYPPFPSFNTMGMNDPYSSPNFPQMPFSAPLKLDASV